MTNATKLYILLFFMFGGINAFYTPQKSTSVKTEVKTISLRPHMLLIMFTFIKESKSSIIYRELGTT